MYAYIRFYSHGLKVSPIFDQKPPQNKISANITGPNKINECITFDILHHITTQKQLQHFFLNIL